MTTEDSEASRDELASCRDIALFDSTTVLRVIDTETTGLDHTVDRIVEAAWADVLASTGTILARYSTLIDPGIPIPPGASAIHHIVDEDVAGKPAWEDQKKFFEAAVYVAHNAEFDSKFCQLPGAWICTHRLAKHLWPDLTGHGNEAIRYARKLKPHTVRDAASHRAVNDVAVTCAILEDALREIRVRWPEVQTVGQLIDRIAQPCLLLIVPFKSAKGVRFEDAETSLLEWIIDRGAGGQDCVHSAVEALAKRRPRRLFEDDGEGDF